MRYLLNTLYAAALLLLLPKLVAGSFRAGKYRRGWLQKLTGRVPRRCGAEPCIWLHAVSLGEMNLLPGVVDRLQDEHPQAQCVISTTTQTGMAAAEKHFAALPKFFFPFDFSWAVNAAFDRVQPTVIVLTELELWPNLITIARARGIDVIVVNARLSDSSYRGYRRAGRLLCPVLARLSGVAAQDPASAERFAALGADPSRVCITGSIKFDGAPLDRTADEVQQLARLAGAAERRIWMAGSTCDPEEAMVLQVYARLRTSADDLRLAIVPRHPERFDAVADLIRAAGLTVRRRSQLRSAAGGWSPGEVLLVDVCGELRSWWGMADIAYVGGSMNTGRGGQNMLEPCGYGLPTCFGPDTRNFRDIVRRLLEVDGAQVVEDASQLEQFVAACLRNPEAAQQRGARAQALIRQGRGATERTVEWIGRWATLDCASPGECERAA